MIIFGYKIKDKTTLIALLIAAVAVVVIIFNAGFGMTTQKERSRQLSTLELRSRELRALEHKGLSSSGARGRGL